MKLFRLIIFVGGVSGVGFVVISGIVQLANSKYATEIALGGLFLFVLGGVAGMALGTLWTAWSVRFGATTVRDAVQSASGSERALASMLSNVAQMGQVLGGKREHVIIENPGPMFPALQRYQLQSGRGGEPDDDD